MRATWYWAPATLSSGSTPLAEAVTRSTGIASGLGRPCGSAALRASMRPLTASFWAGFSGPKLLPPELAALLGIGPVADGRPQKYLGDENDWPISEEPIALPFTSMMLPAAWAGKATLPTPVTASGYSTPQITVRAPNSTRAGRIWEVMTNPIYSVDVQARLTPG